MITESGSFPSRDGIAHEKTTTMKIGDQLLVEIDIPAIDRWKKGVKKFGASDEIPFKGASDEIPFKSLEQVMKLPLFDEDTQAASVRARMRFHKEVFHVYRKVLGDLLLLSEEEFKDVQRKIDNIFRSVIECAYRQLESKIASTKDEGRLNQLMEYKAKLIIKITVIKA